MPPIICGQFRARKIRIDDAPSRAARCRRVALGQRRVAAFVIVRSRVPHVQANRISRIVHLGRRRPYRDRPDRQNRQGQNTHQNLHGNWWLGGRACPMIPPIWSGGKPSGRQRSARIPCLIAAFRSIAVGRQPSDRASGNNFASPGIESTAVTADLGPARRRPSVG